MQKFRMRFVWVVCSKQGTLEDAVSPHGFVRCLGFKTGVWNLPMLVYFSGGGDVNSTLVDDRFSETADSTGLRTVFMAPGMLSFSSHFQLPWK